MLYDSFVLAAPLSLEEKVMTFVSEQGMELVVNVLAATVIFFVGRRLAKLISNISKKLMKRAAVDETLTGFLSALVYALLLALVVVASLDRLGVNTTSLAAVVAAAGLAVGLALQSSLSNFAAGVMLILFKPFRKGDVIEAAGTSGVVEEIHIFHTVLRTGDNVRIILPNGQVSGGTITNYSAKATRRIDMVVGCGYGDDLKAVKRYLESLLADDDRILSDPAPVVAVNELGANSVNFVVRPWVANADYWTVRWDLTEKIKMGFDERGFVLPYSQHDVHIHSVNDQREDS